MARKNRPAKPQNTTASTQPPAARNVEPGGSVSLEPDAAKRVIEIGEARDELHRRIGMGVVDLLVLATNAGNLTQELRKISAEQAQKLTIDLNSGTWTIETSKGVLTRTQ